MQYETLIISWEPFQRRMESMAHYMKLKAIYFGENSSSKLLKAYIYLKKTFKTYHAIPKQRDAIIILQLPPIFMLYAAIAAKQRAAISGYKLKVIADCHNGQITGFWSRLPFTTRLLNLCDIVLVHNNDITQKAIELGVKKALIHVLEDAPSSVICDKPNTETQLFENYRSPWLLAPCSFRNDEPIKELFEAANNCPEINFVITGNPNRLAQHNIVSYPSNVHLTGFLSIDLFNRHLCEADGVIGLTKLDGIQLSVANEAIGVNKALLLNRTNTLYNLFSTTAYFSKSTSTEDLTFAFKEFITQLDRYRKLSETFKTIALKKWQKQLTNIPIINDTLNQWTGNNYE